MDRVVQDLKLGARRLLSDRGFAAATGRHAHPARCELRAADDYLESMGAMPWAADERSPRGRCRPRTYRQRVVTDPSVAFAEQ